jgi:hypothetical protein
MALGPTGVASTMTKPTGGGIALISLRGEVRIPHPAGLTWAYTTPWPLGRNTSGYDELPCWVLVMGRAGARHGGGAMRARSLVVALLAVILATVVGCGASGTRASGSTLTLWTAEDNPDRVKATQAIIDRFEQQINIKVKRRGNPPRCARRGVAGVCAFAGRRRHHRP